MPSQSIVRDSRTVIQNRLLPSIPTKWWSQASFGLEAFALRPFQSAGSNARAVVSNANTAASKVQRLLKNHKLTDRLGTVFDALHLVTADSFVNVDHCDFDGLTALVAAVQTTEGRAIPCMVETTYAQSIPADSTQSRWRRLRQDMVWCRQQQCFTGHVIDSLEGLRERLGFWPKLVFDRGFGNESLLTHLAAEGAMFYVRLKAGRYVALDGQQVAVRRLAQADVTIQLFGLTLRVVRSDRDRQCEEPWYILTNDFGSSRDAIVRIYYHRFEIEEIFKDSKHLFELHRLKFNRPTSLKAVLWFVFLGLAILYVASLQDRPQALLLHPKKQVSWVRQAYEQLQRELTSLRNITGLAPRYGVEEGLG